LAIEGIVLVDKPAGPTSHDVVAKVRKAFNTRKVGHAGTLDPMATGMLVIGIGRATRLLGYLTAHDKEYLATMRLGIATDTDDATGEEIARADASTITDKEILETIRNFRGPITQQPSKFSAVKIDGKRAYARVRDGEDIEIPSRDVIVQDLEILDIRALPESKLIDVDIRVVCSAGTYIRALARDIGSELNVGGHLTALRRTRSGQFSEMTPLAVLQENPQLIALSDAVRMSFPESKISTEAAAKARNGVRVMVPPDSPTGVVGVFDPNGDVISISETLNGELNPLVVFATNE
jgi:tRNA pseudouridine55 synthase